MSQIVKSELLRSFIRESLLREQDTEPRDATVTFEGGISAVDVRKLNDTLKGLIELGKEKNFDRTDTQPDVDIVMKSIGEAYSLAKDDTDFPGWVKLGAYCIGMMGGDQRVTAAAEDFERLLKEAADKAALQNLPPPAPAEPAPTEPAPAEPAPKGKPKRKAPPASDGGEEFPGPKKEESEKNLKKMLREMISFYSGMPLVVEGFGAFGDDVLRAFKGLVGTLDSNIGSRSVTKWTSDLIEAFEGASGKVFPRDLADRLISSYNLRLAEAAERTARSLSEIADNALQAVESAARGGTAASASLEVAAAIKKLDWPALVAVIRRESASDLFNTARLSADAAEEIRKATRGKTLSEMSDVLDALDASINRYQGKIIDELKNSSPNMTNVDSHIKTVAELGAARQAASKVASKLVEATADDIDMIPLQRGFLDSIGQSSQMLRARGMRAARKAAPVVKAALSPQTPRAARYTRDALTAAAGNASYVNKGFSGLKALVGAAGTYGAFLWDTAYLTMIIPGLLGRYVFESADWFADLFDLVQFDKTLMYSFGKAGAVVALSAGAVAAYADFLKKINFTPGAVGAIRSAGEKVLSSAPFGIGDAAKQQLQTSDEEASGLAPAAATVAAGASSVAAASSAGGLNKFIDALGTFDIQPGKEADANVIVQAVGDQFRSMSESIAVVVLNFKENFKDGQQNAVSKPNLAPALLAVSNELSQDNFDKVFETGSVAGVKNPVQQELRERSDLIDLWSRIAFTGAV